MNFKQDTARAVTYMTGLDARKAIDAINLMKQSGAPFTVSMTNYTINIKGSVNYKFMKQERSVKFFNMFTALKKEVQTYLEKNPIPEIEKVFYYDIAPKEDFSEAVVYNVDLTSAYLHVLKNENVISPEMFDKLNALDKQDRLSVVGMLASRKSVYHFDASGNMEKHEIQEDRALRNVFFHCVNVTHHIMQHCKMLLEENYIYSWVDGVYFTGRENYYLIEDFLLSIKYPFVLESLENFAYENTREHVNISFDKGIKTKCFQIPKGKNKFAADMYKFLQTQQ